MILISCSLNIFYTQNLVNSIFMNDARHHFNCREIYNIFLQPGDFNRYRKIIPRSLIVPSSNSQIMKDNIEQNTIEQAIAGSDAAFEELVRSHYDLVFRFACKYLGKKDEAEDVTQEVFIKVARKIHTFEMRSSFSSWLYRVTINTAKDYLRKKGTHKAEPYVNGVHVRVQHVSTNPGIEHDILQAVHNLPEKLRDAAMLVFAQQLSHAEAAKILGVAEGTVSWRIFQAKKKIRKALS